MNSVLLALVVANALLPAASPDWTGLCGLSSADFERLDRGVVIARVLPAAEPREVGIFAAARVPITRETFLRWYRDIENFKHSPVIVEARRYSAVPAAADMNRFELSAQELRDLKNCKPEGCTLKLTAGEMQHFQNLAGSPTAELRQIMAESVERYVRCGEASLTPFSDKPDAPDRRMEFHSLLESSHCVTDRFPGLKAAIGQDPTASGEDDNIFYWAIERYGFGLKPLVTVFHARIHHPDPSALVVSARQIRATHYYDGSLALTLVLDAPGGGVYLVYVNRSRIDLLRGILKGWKRDLVQRKAPGAIRKEMTGLRQKLAEFERKPH